MILIFSSGILDESTEEIIFCLKKLDVIYYKITPLDLAFGNQIEIVNDEIILKVKGESITINIGLINCIYLRKWDIEKEIDYYLSSKIQNEATAKIKSMYISELEAISNYLFYRLNNCKWFPHYSALKSNKIIQSFQAKLEGFKVPDFNITSDKMFLRKISTKKYVTKLINSRFLISHESSVYNNYTTTIKNKSNSENFFPSYIQKNIIKKFEIRTFYFNGDVYSFAIFSQNNYKTTEDYRTYDLKKSNRIVPYKLNEIEINRVNSLMRNLNLSTGSIDFIYTNNDELIFLEINPFGQFDSLSKKCNYSLEQIIVNHLINLR